MLKIVAGDLSIELTTGSPYETGTVPKYYLKYPDDSVAVVYKSGILKSVSDRHFETIRTLGGALVTLEPDVKSGGYITTAPTQEQLERFHYTESRLQALRESVLAGRNPSIERYAQFEYEHETPSDDELFLFMQEIKSRPELDALALDLNKRLGAMDIVHPDIGDRDYLAFSFSQGCDGGCVKCNFQHMRKLVPRAAQELHAQIDFYKNVFSEQERARFDIFAGNHRGLGIDFDLFIDYVGQVKHDAGMSGGRVFAFCNAEDILRLHDRYGTKQLEAAMLRIGLHLNLGIESGSPAGLKEYGKNTTVPTIRKALTILKSMQVRYSVNLVAGVPWEDHVQGTVQLFRALYRPGDNRPAVYSSEFKDKWGNVDVPLEKEQYAIFRTVLNDCGIYVFRYTFIPFNKKG